MTALNPRVHRSRLVERYVYFTRVNHYQTAANLTEDETTIVYAVPHIDTQCDLAHTIAIKSLVYAKVPVGFWL